MPAKPAPIADPYLTLGLEPSAPMAEVKRAYRRLAKAFHPDSAGEQAIPRFLAIQAAYDQIRTGRVTLGGSRGSRGGPAAAGTGTGASTGAGSGPAGEPWRADPARARAARERARAGSPGSASGAGTASGQATGGRRSTGTSGANGSGGTRKRATRKATMGSTSYDEARDPADATWSGASWYGPSTGEYWIVNPREYADPRKHGPGYQQRARRPLQGSADDADADAAAPANPTGDTTTSGPEARFEAPPQPSRPTPRWSASATEAGWAGAGEARRSQPDLDARAPAGLRWLGEPADDPVRRFGLALVAWPPIGLMAAALIGAATGCATFSASCDGSEPLLPWLAQAVILGLLLLAPPVTRILASGSIAVLIGFVPLASLSLAAGAAGAQAAAPVVSGLLVLLWTIGVGWALTRRLARRGAGT